MFDFINISVIDIIDIILVGLLIYQMMRIIRGTSVFNIVTGILLFYLVWVVVKALNMKLLSSILGQILGVGVIALIVIFQPEIRRLLLHIGSRYLSSSRNNLFTRLLLGRNDKEIQATSLDEITQACRRMADTRTGALIVLQHNSSLEFVTETGDRIDAAVNRRLIENIFFKNSPLHDGAMVISKKRIKAAGCILPVSHNLDIPKELGLRHRAAMGISQVSDAHAIIVSEETGGISVAYKGQFYLRLNAEELESLLTKES